MPETDRKYWTRDSLPSGSATSLRAVFWALFSLGMIYRVLLGWRIYVQETVLFGLAAPANPWWMFATSLLNDIVVAAILTLLVWCLQRIANGVRFWNPPEFFLLMTGCVLLAWLAALMDEQVRLLLIEVQRGGPKGNSGDSVEVRGWGEQLAAGSSLFLGGFIFVAASFWRRRSKRCSGLRAPFFMAWGIGVLLFVFHLSAPLWLSPSVPDFFDAAHDRWPWFWKFFRLGVIPGIWSGLIFGGLTSILTADSIRPFVIRHGLILALDLILLTVGFITLSHYRLLFELDSGLTTAMIRATGGMSLRDFFRFLGPSDWLILLAPLAVFHLFLGWPLPSERLGWIRFLLPGMGLLLLVIRFWAPLTQRAELTSAPVEFLVRDAVAGVIESGRNEFAHSTALPGSAQMASLGLVDPAFAASIPFPREIMTRPVNPLARKFNVILFVMESTGAEYVFDSSQGNPVPMPFFQSLTKRGLYLKNHFSASNNSPNGGFSALTGLYPLPSAQLFSLRPENAIPMMNRYLGGDRECFLVHPPSTSYFFPRPMFLHNGFNRLDDQSTIPEGEHRDPNRFARNDIDAMTFFMKEVESAKQPFFGIYWSYVPHHPYSDYGPEFRVLPYAEAGENRRNRYYNNLRVLDEQIRRLWQHLETRGLLESTVLVFIGDHGEAFGQHTGVWGHNVGPYSETYRTPALFVQSSLFPPAEIPWPTSHVDILPTLLDATGIEHDRNLFQGESLFREGRRRFVFTWSGDGNYLAAIDRNGIKVALPFLRGEPLAFNTVKDPMEKLPLQFRNYPGHVDALVRFRNYQNQVLPEYNEAVRNGRLFHGIQVIPPVSSSESGK